MSTDQEGQSGGSSEPIPLCHVQLADLIITNPVTVSEQTSLREVVEKMQTRRVGAVLVTRDNRVCGVFSEWHLVERVIGEDISYDEPVGRFLDDDPVCLKTTDDVGKAIDLMAQRELRYLPVCGDNMEIRGILSVRRIIDCLAQQYPAEVINQPPRPDQHMTTPEGG